MNTVTRILMTVEGKTSLEEELKKLSGPVHQRLEEKILEATKIFEKTADDSDLRIAKDRQSFNNFRILQLKEKLANSEAISSNNVSLTEVGFGSKVTLENVKRESLTIKIVGMDEANIRIDKVSIDSPIAQKLLGKKVGDQVQLNMPYGITDFTVVALGI